VRFDVYGDSIVQGNVRIGTGGLFRVLEEPGSNPVHPGFAGPSLLIDGVGGADQTGEADMIIGRDVVFDDREIVMNADPRLSRVRISDSQTVTFDQDTTLNATGPGRKLITGGEGGGVTVENHGTVNAAEGELQFFHGGEIVNSGLMRAEPGSSLAFGPTRHTITNAGAGSIVIENGARLAFVGAEAFAFTKADIDQTQFSPAPNAQVQIGGERSLAEFDNTGNELSPDDFFGGRDLVLRNADISGGIVRTEGAVSGKRLIVERGARVNSGFNVFRNGARLGGGYNDGGAESRARFSSGATFTGDLTLTAPGSWWAIDDDAELDAGLVTLSAPDGQSPARFTILNNDKTVELRPSFIVEGTNGVVGTDTVGQDSAAGSTLVLKGGRIQTEGVMRIRTAGRSGPLGQIAANSGSFENRSGGVLALGGGIVIIEDSDDVVNYTRLSDTAGILEGGRWIADADSEIRWDTQSQERDADGFLPAPPEPRFTINRAAIDLIGPGSRIDPIEFLERNEAAGDISIADGRVFQPAGDADGDLFNSGDIRLRNGGRLNVNGSLDNQGLIEIDGPSLAEVAGDFETSGELAIGIAGLAEFGRIDAAGELLFDGSLAVELLNGYEPQEGDRFEFADGATRTGEFLSLGSPAFGPADSLFFTVEYSPSGAALVVVPSPGGAALIAIGAGVAVRRRRGVRTRAHSRGMEAHNCGPGQPSVRLPRGGVDRCIDNEGDPLRYER
jgi:hypothetical protein